MTTKMLFLGGIIVIGAFLLGTQISTKTKTVTITKLITPTITPTNDADKVVGGWLKSLTPTVTQQNISYRQTFMSICKTGEIYCTCMYDVMSQNYSDSEIQNEIKSKGENVLYSGYGSNGQESPMVINALTDCNNRFKSK